MAFEHLLRTQLTRRELLASTLFLPLIEFGQFKEQPFPREAFIAQTNALLAEMGVSTGEDIVEVGQSVMTELDPQSQDRAFRGSSIGTYKAFWQSNAVSPALSSGLAYWSSKKDGNAAYQPSPAVGTNVPDALQAMRNEGHLAMSDTTVVPVGNYSIASTMGNQFVDHPDGISGPLVQHISATISESIGLQTRQFIDTEVFPSNIRFIRPNGEIIPLTAPDQFKVLFNQSAPFAVYVPDAAAWGGRPFTTDNAAVVFDSTLDGESKTHRCLLQTPAVGL
ncbi:hypothetical protein HY469_05330 [Candidatus Roizmanbacteria bacterium]|nr:hypothetical protein [Candidatus Roizmanbacteria bacterium]